MGSIFPNSTGQFLVCAVEFTRLLSNSAFVFGKVCPCFPWTDHCQWNHYMFTHKTTMFHHVLAIKPPLFIISKPKKPHKSTTVHRFLSIKPPFCPILFPWNPAFSPRCVNGRFRCITEEPPAVPWAAARPTWPRRPFGRRADPWGPGETVGDPMDRKDGECLSWNHGWNH